VGTSQSGVALPPMPPCLEITVRLRRRARPMHPDLQPVTDDLPRDKLFTQPLVVAVLTATEPEPQADGGVRVTFRATVKDADGKRCPDLAVDATIAGPERTASGMAHSDLMGNVKFRMTGPAGRYTITIDDVAAGGLAWDRSQGVTSASVDVT
jgi:hypothetical protein